MATQQDEGGVPFSIAHDLQQFRLLELPAGILELIDAPNPPALSIKSQAASRASGTPNPKAAYAVLCTPNKTFQLRQVQTSNSVFVTQPRLEGHGNEIPVPTTCAVASCTATLELHPTVESSAPYLKEALPIYDIIDGMVDVAGNGKSKTRILSDVPLSNGECEVGWKELIAFEFAGSSYRPSANTLAQVWKSINAAALAGGTKLDSQFLTEEILKAMDEEGYPSELITAIFRRLAADEQDTNGPWSCLDRTKTVHFVGITLLEAREGEANYLTAEFLNAWKDCVPESWRTDAELSTIKDAYVLPSTMTIAVKGVSASSAKTEDSTPKVGSSSRKWHERFGRARQR
ncbi:hypothetical protein K469DRAFT_567272 [Zopfia rhizophila CBS 207.26]|uniref:Sister chromatid cohesion protein-like protein Dcc1 n=1 Tax=Zopfia rhizophila CBS 207.26 TaxID=1314779 RepID=A0A6A6EE08_9PEZI|nr:hypothetical protein K469DRAFT_567272 [Zopfia rhizophila CBS 207.26]